MSATVHSFKHSTHDRTEPSRRKVVVPDRMILRHSKGAAPIINMQSLMAPVVIPKKQPSVRQKPIASTKVHTTIQKGLLHTPVRPIKRSVDTSVAHSLNVMLDRRNALPKHLARTASRAHLLSQIAQPEPQKQRWHQKIFAGLMG